MHQNRYRNTTGAEEGIEKSHILVVDFSLTKKVSNMLLFIVNAIVWYTAPVFYENRGKSCQNLHDLMPPIEPTQELYSRKDIVDICLKLCKQANSRASDARQVCMIDGAEFILTNDLWICMERLHGPRVDRVLSR